MLQEQREVLRQQVRDEIVSVLTECHLPANPSGRVYVPRVRPSKDALTPQLFQALNITEIPTIYITAPGEQLEGSEMSVAVRDFSPSVVWGGPSRMGLGFTLAGLSSRYEFRRPLELPFPKKRVGSSLVWLDPTEIKDHHITTHGYGLWISFGREQGGSMEKVLTFMEDVGHPGWFTHLVSTGLPHNWRELAQVGKLEI